MKASKRRKREEILNTLSWFIPELDTFKYGYGNKDLKEGGVDAIGAFFDKTDKGIEHSNIDNLELYNKLMEAQRRMSIHIQMWAEGFREGTLFISDFDDEPIYIQKLIHKAIKLGTRLKGTQMLGHPNEVYNYVMRE